MLLLELEVAVVVLKPALPAVVAIAQNRFLPSKKKKIILILILKKERKYNLFSITI